MSTTSRNVTKRRIGHNDYTSKSMAAVFCPKPSLNFEWSRRFHSFLCIVINGYRHLELSHLLVDDPEPSGLPSPSASASRDAREASSEGATFPPSTAARPVPSDAPLTHPHLYFNRELSTLDFNWRVLHQALDERTPLLERVFFTAITANNLDEFFQKRVGGLKRQAAAGVSKLSADGRTPEEQLALIRPAVLNLYGTMTTFWTNTLAPLLRDQADIRIVNYADLSTDQRASVDAYFQENIFSVLTPLAVDPGHPFPFISNLSLSLAITLYNPAQDAEQFARIKVPTNHSRWVPLENPHHLVPLEQVIAHGEKERFTLSDDGSKIRANYGHSVDVDLEVEPAPPPETLYHGTARRVLGAIREEGLTPQARQYVHLSTTPADARQVGARHGAPVVLHVRAADLHAEGHSFYRTAADVWLTPRVPSRALVFPDDRGAS